VQADLSVGAPDVPQVDVDELDATAPGFGDAPRFDDDELGPVPVITPAQVRDILDGAGRAFSVPPLHLGIPGLWRFTPDELDGLAPPLTRIVNRRPALARAVAKGDEVLVLLQLAGYFGRRGDVIAVERRRRLEEDAGGDDQREADRDGARDLSQVRSTAGAPTGDAPYGG
jgi:hypothetical protein